MRDVRCELLEKLDSAISATGACAWGICPASEVEPGVMDMFRQWIENGRHAGTSYLERHVALKKNPESVLKGCRSVMSLAFPYMHVVGDRVRPVISRHALGKDYHRVLPRLLTGVCSVIKDVFGGETRVCVDSAPVPERYWAVKCGVGSIGRNGLLYVPGYGSWVFLAEIFTTALLPERDGGNRCVTDAMCAGCRLCIEACPGQAIGSDCFVDCRRCRSYLTIECRSDTLPVLLKLGSVLYGCDICQEVCPINKNVLCGLDVFAPKSEAVSLTASDIAALDEVSFRRIFSDTPVRRVKLWQLKRNADSGK